MAILKVPHKGVLEDVLHYIPMENIAFVRVHERSIEIVLNVSDSYSDTHGTMPYFVQYNLDNKELAEKVAELILYYRQYLAKNAKVVDIEKIVEEAKKILNAKKQKAKSQS